MGVQNFLELALASAKSRLGKKPREKALFPRCYVHLEWFARKLGHLKLGLNTFARLIYITIQNHAVHWSGPTGNRKSGLQVRPKAENFEENTAKSKSKSSMGLRGALGEPTSFYCVVHIIAFNRKGQVPRFPRHRSCGHCSLGTLQSK